jgi:hypothetical protein
VGGGAGRGGQDDGDADAGDCTGRVLLPAVEFPMTRHGRATVLAPDEPRVTGYQDPFVWPAP